MIADEREEPDWWQREYKDMFRREPIDRLNSQPPIHPRDVGNPWEMDSGCAIVVCILFCFLVLIGVTALCR